MNNQTTAMEFRSILREGLNYLNAGRINEASKCCQRVLSVKSDVPEAHFLVGLIALELNQTRTALNAFGSVTKLNSKHGAAWANMAKLFLSAGQPRRADSALNQAQKSHDNNPMVFDLIGVVCGLLGDQEDASRWLKRAVASQPNNVGFLINRANNLMFLGEIMQAESMLDKVLSLHRDNANAHWIKANIKKVKDHHHIDEMKVVLEKQTSNLQAVSFISYAIGKEYEDLEAWPEAFKAFSVGASARRKLIEFDENAEGEMYAAFMETYTKEWLAGESVGINDNSPIFIVGQPRTGTTLVERIITSHSQVQSAGELQQFGTSIRRLCDYREPKRSSAKLAFLAASIDAEKLGKAYISTTIKQRGTLPRFVDKLPGNYLYLPLILRALPNAKIIHLQRHPMDACFASYKQLFADAYPHSYDQKEMARHHVRYLQLMDHWRYEFPGRFFEIAYEDVAQDTEKHSRALIDYLGLPWEDACINFHEQSSAVTTASAVQVREPAHTRSIGRWRHYETDLSEMRLTLESGLGKTF